MGAGVGVEALLVEEEDAGAEERRAMRSAPTVTETRIWERGLRPLLGSVHG